jgi:CHASE2 domain-containing sensor protein
MTPKAVVPRNSVVVSWTWVVVASAVVVVLPWSVVDGTNVVVVAGAIVVTVVSTDAVVVS